MINKWTEGRDSIQKHWLSAPSETSCNLTYNVITFCNITAACISLVNQKTQVYICTPLFGGITCILEVKHGSKQTIKIAKMFVHLKNRRGHILQTTTATPGHLFWNPPITVIIPVRGSLDSFFFPKCKQVKSFLFLPSYPCGSGRRISQSDLPQSTPLLPKYCNKS